MKEFNICIPFSTQALGEIPIILDLDCSFNYIRKDMLDILGYYPQWLEESPEMEDIAYLVLGSDGKIAYDSWICETFIIVHELTVPLKLGRNCNLLKLFAISDKQRLLVPVKRRFPSTGISFQEVQLQQSKASQLKQGAQNLKKIFKPIDTSMFNLFSRIQWSFIYSMVLEKEAALPEWRSLIFCPADNYECPAKLLNWRETLK